MGNALEYVKPNSYHNVDCMEAMREIPDKYFDLAIVDPDYNHGSIGVRSAKDVVQKSGTVLHVNSTSSNEFEKTETTTEYFDELYRVSKNQIVWGFNFLREVMPKQYNSKGIIVWDKINDGADQYPVEIAYQSLDDKPHLLRYLWRGMLQGKSLAEGYVQQGDKSLNEQRIHLYQKPVALYQWLIQEFEISKNTNILDTHVGSASSLIAYHRNSINYVGFELSEPAYKLSKQRLESERAQLSLFL